MRLRQVLTVFVATVPLLLAPSVARAKDLALERGSFTVATADEGLPSEFRTDGHDLFVVTRGPRGNATFLVFNSQSGTQRAVTVRPPATLSHFQVFCVDRIDESHFVASAGWSEGGYTRNGLAFFGEDGLVSQHVGYGFTMRAIATSQELNLIAASIQGPRPAESTTLNAPAMFSLALFDLTGKFLAQTGSTATNRYLNFDDMKRAIRSRKPFFFRDTVMFSIPERSARDTDCAFEALPASTVRIGDRKSRATTSPHDYVDVAWLQPPIVEGISEDRLRMVNVVPVLSENKTALLAVWLVGEGGKDWTKPLIRDAGRALLAVYAPEGKRPTRWQYLPEGAYIGEITSTTDGRAFVITFTDIKKAWSIAEVTF